MTGSGINSNIYLNQKKKIRAALVHTNYIADICRKVKYKIIKHNNANIMVLPSACIGVELCKSLINTYINSGFDG